VDRVKVNSVVLFRGLLLALLFGASHVLPPPKVPSFLHGHLLPSDSSVCVPPE
jgi:hypothetical protein